MNRSDAFCIFRTKIRPLKYIIMKNTSVHNSAEVKDSIQ